MCTGPHCLEKRGEKGEQKLEGSPPYQHFFSCLSRSTEGRMGSEKHGHPRRGRRHQRGQSHVLISSPSSSSNHLEMRTGTRCPQRFEVEVSLRERQAVCGRAKADHHGKHTKLGGGPQLEGKRKGETRELARSRVEAVAEPPPHSRSLLLPQYQLRGRDAMSRKCKAKAKNEDGAKTEERPLPAEVS